MVHEDPDKADTVIAGLSDLLRRTLELGFIQEMPFSRELDARVAGSSARHQSIRRIHRSAIVGIDRVAETRATSHGDAEVLLRDGTKLTASRTWREGLQLVLASHFRK